MPQLHITRDLDFDAGHRVLGHESKCAHLHGHRYKAEIMVEAPELDRLGRIIDFSLIKSLVGRWIDDHWDHNMILHEHDPLWEVYGLAIAGDKEWYTMSKKRNTTAECLAMELAEIGQRLLPEHIRIIQVTIHETPSCRATFIPDR